MKRPPLSIIIVTYNNQDHIQKALTSLPWNDFRPQLIVVDNHSSDQTRHRTDAFRKANPSYRIEIVNNTYNLGYARAVNQALDRVTGEVLLLLGPDASLFPEAASKLINVLNENPNAGITAPQLVDAEGSIIPSCRRFPTVGDMFLELSTLPRIFPSRIRPRWKMPDFNHQTQREVEQPEATCLLIRRKVFEEIGGMDERFPIFFNDVDWCRRILAGDWKIVFEPSAKAFHAGGGSVMQFPIPMIWKSHQGFYRYFSKYRRSLGQRMWNPFLGLLLILTAAYRSCLSLFIKTM